MKKIVLFLSTLLLGLSNQIVAQMTLAHYYPVNFTAETEIVNLSNSGKKILTISNQTGSDTLSFYNMNYSLWKQVVCPAIPGYQVLPLGFFRSGPTVFYPSETLFNLDTFLEVAVQYHRTTGSNWALFIINENGVAIDSVPNLNLASPNYFKVWETSPGVFKATALNNNGVTVYDLPGTIPCNICGNGLGLAREEKNTDKILTMPIPNPSSNQVKITFTLPEGTSQAELELYNNAGQKISTYKVDNRFGFIMLDNAALPAGLYYYNISANGIISSTQKMVLVK